MLGSNPRPQYFSEFFRTNMYADGCAKVAVGISAFCLTRMHRINRKRICRRPPRIGRRHIRTPSCRLTSVKCTPTAVTMPTAIVTRLSARKTCADGFLYADGWHGQALSIGYVCRRFLVFQRPPVGCRHLYLYADGPDKKPSAPRKPSETGRFPVVI